jgi:hypothetical protein
VACNVEPVSTVFKGLTLPRAERQIPMFPIVLLLANIFSPYIFTVGGISVKLSYPLDALAIAYLGYYLLAGIRNGIDIGAAKSTVLLLIFVLWTYAVSMLRRDNMTYDSVVFLLLLSLNISLFALLWLWLIGRPLSYTGRLAERLLPVLLVGGVLLSIIAIVEYYYPSMVHAFYLQDDELGHAGMVWGTRYGLVDSRVGSAFGAPNRFGAFHIVTLPVALYYLLYHKGIRGRFIGGLALILGMISLGLSYSRGAFLGVAVALGVYLLCKSVKYFVTFALLGAGIFFAFMNTIEMYLLAGKEAPYLERMGYWQTAYELAREGVANLLIGYGPYNAEFASENIIKSAHNVFITTLNFLGIIGCAILILFVVSFSRDLLMLVRHKATFGFANDFPELMLAGFIGLVTHSMFDDMLIFNSKFMLVYFIIMAIAGAIGYQCKVYSRGGARVRQAYASSGRRYGVPGLVARRFKGQRA